MNSNRQQLREYEQNCQLKFQIQQQKTQIEKLKIQNKLFEQ